MKKKLFLLLEKNIIIKSSFILLSGSVLINLGSYLYHLLMGRLLGPSDYGLLESLISLTYFLGIPLSVLTLAITKYISSEKKDTKKISRFLKKILKDLSLYGTITFFLFLLFYPLLKRFLHVDSFLLIFGVGLSAYIGIFSSIFFAVFQGFAEFLKISLLGIIGSWSKVFLSLILVILGMKVFGAVYGTFFSIILTTILSYLWLKGKMPSVKNGELNDEKNLFDGFGKYYFFVFIGNFSLTSIYTTDIIMAKVILPPKEAGYYAALSVLGKIIFFASTPIVTAMFPIISTKNANGEKYKFLLLQSLVLTLLICTAVSLVYYFFPAQMINLLFGKEYLESSRYLWMFGLFISIYSICYLLHNYFLSISKLKMVFASLLTAILQILLIFFFKNQGIQGIIMANIISVSLLLIILLLLYTVNAE